jgi:hypothetical protein
MRRLGLLPVLLAAALLLPSAGGAKEIERAVVCGAAECRTVAGGMKELGFLVEAGGTESVPGPDGVAFFTIETFATGGDGDDDAGWTIAYMPETGYARSLPVGADRVVWWKLTPAEQRPFDALVRGLEPQRGAPPARSPSSFPWWETLAGALAACAVAVAALFLAPRTRGRRSAAPAR